MTPTEVNRLTLNSRSKNYLEEVLNQGHSLAQLLRQRKDLVQGPATTYLPFVPDDEALYAFKRGIFSAVNSLPPPRGVWVAKPNVDEVLSDVLLEFLNGSQERCIIFEEYLLRTDDLASGGIETRVLTFGQEVYHLLTHDDADNADLIQATIRRARSWQFLGVLAATTPKDQSDLAILSSTDLGRLSDRAAAIVVGAYDNEGFILSPDLSRDASQPSPPRDAGQGGVSPGQSSE